MIYFCLVLLLFVHCTHSLSFQFAATQSPISHYGESTISATCDPTRKCGIGTSSRSTCERWGCCFQNNDCFAKKYFIINQGPPKKKVPSQFTVPLEKSTDGRMLSIMATRADALKYCQDNYPNGGLPVPTATANWLTQAGRIEMFKDVITGNAIFAQYRLDLYYNHVTDEVSTVAGEFVAKGADFEDNFFFRSGEFRYLILSGDLQIMNGNIGLSILCQHD